MSKGNSHPIKCGCRCLHPSWVYRGFCASDGGADLPERRGDLNLTSGKKFTLVGTPQGHEIKDPNGVLGFTCRIEIRALISCHCGLELLNLPDVVNDLDVDLAIDPVAAAAYLNDQRNLRKVREHTAKLQLNIINPPRPGKRLLVLDIDYSKASMVLALVFAVFTRNNYQQYSTPNPSHLERFPPLNAHDLGSTSSWRWYTLTTISASGTSGRARREDRLSLTGILGRKPAGYGLKPNLLSLEWWARIRTTRQVARQRIRRTVVCS